MDTVSKFIASREPVTIEAYRHIDYALEVMEKENNDALGVSFFGEFAGILTRSDIVRKAINKGFNPRTTLVHDVMTFNVISITPNTTIKSSYDVMLKNKISHLPVVDAKHKGFLGIVSEEDLRYDIHKMLEQTANENRLIISYIYGENYALGASY